MRPLPVAWPLGPVALAAGVWATYVTCPGCVDRTRVARRSRPVTPPDSNLPETG
jgi:hypothetical protein